jgi:hypothetical protein
VIAISSYICWIISQLDLKIFEKWSR